MFYSILFFQEYKNYLQTLLDYIYNFITRTKPLLNIEKELTETMSEFEVKYEAGTLPGWPKETGSALTHSGKALLAPIDILNHQYK